MYIFSSFAYCYHSVSVISYGLGQSDHSSLYRIRVTIQCLFISLLFISFFYFLLPFSNADFLKYIRSAHKHTLVSRQLNPHLNHQQKCFIFQKMLMLSAMTSHVKKV